MAKIWLHEADTAAFLPAIIRRTMPLVAIPAPMNCIQVSRWLKTKNPTSRENTGVKLLSIPAKPDESSVSA